MLVVGAAAIFLMQGMPASSAQEKKKFKTKEFQDMPLVVREVRNLESDTWHKDLEIEVKNISSKPIYFILAYLVFPDDKAASGESGIPLDYGTPENEQISHYAVPEDIHLDPGQTCVLNIPENLRKPLENRRKSFPDVHKNMLLKFPLISFGDGTGFEAGAKIDLRSKKNHSLTQAKKKRSQQAGLAFKSLSSGKYQSHAPASVQSECGNTNCWPWKISNPVPTSCPCGNTRIGVIEAGRPCRRLMPLYFPC